MKIISLIVMIVFLSYYTWTGSYDPFSLTTTSDIKTNYSKYIGKELKIQLATLLSSEVVKQDGGKFLVKFTAYNGRVLSIFKKLDSTESEKYKDKSIDIYAWIDNKSELWNYVDKKQFRFGYIKLKIEKDYILMTKYSSGEVAEDLLVIPYALVFLLSNLFLPMLLSVILASIIQLLIIWGVIVLIREGVAFLPSAE